MRNRNITLYLIRHAQSHPTTAIANSEWPLSEKGRHQAVELSKLLVSLDIKRIYTSPYRRCRMTIEPYVSYTGIPVIEVQGLHERNIAPGLIPDFQDVWDRSWRDFDFAVPGCESSRVAQKRFASTIEHLVADPDLPDVIACSTHGNVIGLFLNYIDPENGKTETEAIRNPDVIRIRYTQESYHWDRDFSLSGLESFATGHEETPIETSDR